MAKYTSASKKFFKKPNKFRSDTKPNHKGSLFENPHVQKAETGTTNDFFLKSGEVSVNISSNTSEYLDRREKDNSSFKQRKTSYQARENQPWSLKNTDTDTSKMIGRGSKNLLFHNKRQTNQQQNSQRWKETKDQRTDKGVITKNFVRNSIKQKSDFSNDAIQFDRGGNDQVSKKPFDKKKYRLQKYSKKYKLQQWEDKRKKAIMHEYYKTVSKDDEKGLDVEKIYQESEMQEADEENDNNVNAGITGEHKPSKSGGTDADTVKQTLQDSKAKKKPFKRVQEEFKRMKEEKVVKREEFLKKKAEKEEARKKYKKEKVERFKKLSRRTKKGQPIMKDRIEMLLEKIQKDIQS